MIQTPQSTDFAICGGGLAGALLALLLTKRGYSVALIERKKAALPEETSPLDTRALALNYGTVELFKNWGFADLIQDAQFIKNIHVSDKGHFGIVHISAEEEQLPYLGAVIPFEQLVFALQQKVENTPQITFIEDEILQFEQKHTVHIRLKQGHSLTSSILIGADGSESFIRKALGIPLAQYDYKANAVIGKVRVNKQVSDYAFERFTEQGPIALLPAGNCLYTLVWVQQEAKELPGEQAFLKTLQQIFGYRAGIFIEHGIMKSYPLKRLEAEQTYMGRIGLLGNAAHMLHPVAGQGFNLTVRDILTFLEVLDMNKSLDADLWMEYDKRARFQQKTIKMLTHSFVKGFETSRPIISTGRNLLLQVLEWNQTGRTFLNNMMVGKY